MLYKLFFKEKSLENKDNSSQSDVVICGGALAGMTLALALKQKGFNIILVDPRSVEELINKDRRTTAIAEGPKKFYEELGVWRKVKKYAEPIKIINIKDGNSFLDLNFDFQDLKDKKNINNLGYVIENSYLIENINVSINERKKIGSIKRLKASVVSINNKGVLAEVILSNKKVLKTNLVVAADGKNSVIRNMIGIEAKKTFYDQEAFVCNILHTKKHNNIALEKFLPGGPLAILPMKNLNNQYRSSVIWSDKKLVTRSRVYNSKDNLLIVSKEIERHCIDWIGKIKLLGKPISFPLDLTLPKHITGNRFVLMGDAAHSIHPIAGQGFNLSIRDIKFFVKECTARTELGLDIGSLKFLRSFEKKRIFDINSLVNATHFLNQLFRYKNSNVKFIRRTGLSAVQKSTIIKRFFMKYAMGI